MITKLSEMREYHGKKAAAYIRMMSQMPETLPGSAKFALVLEPLIYHTAISTLCSYMEKKE